MLSILQFNAPTSGQRLAAWPRYWLFQHVACRIVPHRWLLEPWRDEPRERSLRLRIALWAYGGSWWNWERTQGRI